MTYNDGRQSRGTFGKKNVQTASPSRALSPESVENVIALRKKMLLSLKRNVDSTLYEVLEKKIRYEHASLLELAEADAKIAEVRKRFRQVLRTEYFIQKSFDTNIF